jgi:hypothetical protein
VVRRRSAKPLFTGSNPVAASNKNQPFDVAIKVDPELGRADKGVAGGTNHLQPLLFYRWRITRRSDFIPSSTKENVFPKRVKRFSSLRAPAFAELSYDRLTSRSGKLFYDFQGRE